MPNYDAPILHLPDVNATEMRASNTVLLSSDTRDWHGIAARLYQIINQPTFVATPEEVVTQMNTVAMVINSAVKASSRTSRSVRDYVAHSGNMELIPRDFDGASRWIGSAQLLHIYLAPTLVAQVADEVGRTDPERIQLARQLDLYDPLLHQIGLALVTELRTGGVGGRLYAESLGTAAALHLIRTYSSFAIARPVLERKLGMCQGELDSKAE